MLLNILTIASENDDVFLCSFGRDSNGVKRLDSPYLVIMCMSLIGWVIVCQCSLLQVIMSPHLVSVVIGKVSFVYVADSNNHRVQCF